MRYRNHPRVDVHGGTEGRTEVRPAISKKAGFINVKSR